jgi:nucleotide-binding universal stress UspA family protein
MVTASRLPSMHPIRTEAIVDSSATHARIILRNILFLTDFSEPSRAALPFAVVVAREFGATVHALHVLIPQPLIYTAAEMTASAIEAQEENAQAEMLKVEAELEGLPHEVSVVHSANVWPALDQASLACQANLIVLGTHGRTGVPRFLLGSVAEEIFRRSSVPVLTIGPWVRKRVHATAHFRRVLFTTDFTAESLVALPYALSLAQENEARLILLHVVHERERSAGRQRVETTVAYILHELHELVPTDAELWCRPEAVVEYGDPAERILEAAREREADLIVLGVRNKAAHLRAATHVERAVAHMIVAHANCPVLTVRG